MQQPGRGVEPALQADVKVQISFGRQLIPCSATPTTAHSTTQIDSFGFGFGFWSSLKK